MTLSQALLDPVGLIDSRTFARITIDADINYEDVAFIRDLFENQLNALEISFIHNRNNMEDFEVDDSNISFESVDSIVISHLKSIESTSMDAATLIDIYHSI